MPSEATSSPTASRILTGQLVVTPKARSRVPEPDMMIALHSHRGVAQVRGETTRARPPGNLFSLDGCRLLTAHRTATGQRFWIISEADRSRTAVLLPEEY